MLSEICWSHNSSRGRCLPVDNDSWETATYIDRGVHNRINDKAALAKPMRKTRSYVHVYAYRVKENVLGKDEVFKGTCYVTKYAVMQINGYTATHELRVYISAQFQLLFMPIIIAGNGAPWQNLRMSAKQCLWQCSTGMAWKSKVSRLKSCT